MTTLQLSTDDHLQDEQTWYQPGSLASLTALQENVSRLVTSVISGAKSSGYWGKRNPDGSWEKTSQDSLALNLDDSLGAWSMTWPRWGLVSGGVCMELATLELSTGATASSLLPTARSSLAMSQPLKNYPSGVKGRLEAKIAIEMLPTPTASDGTTGAIIGENDQFKQLPSGALRKITQNGTNGSLGLARTVMLLPTPRGQCATTPHPHGGEGFSPTLHQRLLPTPTAGNFNDGENPDQWNARAQRLKQKHGNGNGAGKPASVRLQEETGVNGVLNPYFVQEMMGFPTGWLD